MNVTNIMIELLKEAKKDKLNKYFIKENGEAVYLSEAHYIYKIRRDDFLLDVNKLIEKGIKRSFSIEKYFTPTDTREAKKTGYTKELEKIGKLVEFECEENFIYIDERFLKNYDKNATFKGTNGKSPLYVLENDEVVGLILPINIK